MKQILEYIFNPFDAKLFHLKYVFQVKRVPVTTACRVLGLRMEETASKCGGQSWTSDKGSSCSFAVGRGLTSTHSKRSARQRNESRPSDLEGLFGRTFTYIRQVSKEVGLVVNAEKSRYMFVVETEC